MIWIIHFILSVLILASSVGTIVYCRKKKIKRNKFFDDIKIVMYGVAVSAFVLYIPYYFDEITTAFRYVQAIFVSIYSVIRTFTFDGDYSFFIEAINTGTKAFDTIYLTYSILLMVSAPFCTVGVALSFFKDLTAAYNYHIRRHKETYVFSALNERSLTLAKDIHNHHPGAVIVFADVGNEEEEKEEEIIKEAADIDGICFKKDVLSIKLKLNELSKRTVFFIMGESDSDNTDIAMKLIADYRNRANTELYLFSDSVESSLLMAAADKGKIKVRRINEVKSLIYRNLFDNGHVLFDNAVKKDDGLKHITAVIIGLGRYGSIMLKALAWYCQMDGYRINITAIDKDENAEERFTSQCTALMAKENCGVYIDGEAQYDIKIYPGVDIDSKKFGDIIRNLPETTYVFAALGTDEDNIRAAIQMRMMCERMNAKPVVQAVLHSSAKKEALKDICNFSNQPYDISYFGDLESSYTEAVIIDSELEDAALKCHFGWSGKTKDKAWFVQKEKEFWDFEYNYYSSMASAIHISARIHCKIAGAEKEEDKLTKEEAEILGNLEHRRWNAYMRSEGYAYSGSDDPSTKNHLAKTHNNLVPTSWLDDEDKKKDIRVGTV